MKLSLIHILWCAVNRVPPWMHTTQQPNLTLPFSVGERWSFTGGPHSCLLYTSTITAPTIPAWLILTDHGDGSATLAGTPDETQMGYYSIELLVTDSFGLTEPQSFKIKVSSNQNFYPYFFSLFFHQAP